MCTVMLVPETLQAQMTPAAVARKQVDELIKREQEAIAEFRKERRECKEDGYSRKIPGGHRRIPKGEA